jgi:hypothetical protein
MNSLKRMSFKHKNNKFSYYFANYARLLVPEIFYRVRLNKQLKKLKKYDTAYIDSRVNYYNKLVKNQTLPADTEKLSDLRIIKLIFLTVSYTPVFSIPSYVSTSCSGILQRFPIRLQSLKADPFMETIQTPLF